jgi:methylthioribose-1-phosphate isomerase
MYPAVEWREGAVWMIDQRRLPFEQIMVEHRTVQDVAESIRSMVIRGAPAIGVAAAYGLALAARQYASFSRDIFEQSCDLLAATRPTAVNLVWALNRMRGVWDDPLPGGSVAERLLGLALQIDAEDVQINRKMGQIGASLLPETCAVLTHCNAGALATSGYGTALGVIRAAVSAGKKITVWADETRPFLQGARLTVWELQEDGIPVTLITDNMAASMMQAGKVDAVIVGADRVAANGDVANKIGTYGLAVLARYHGIPFYVAAPLSTIDLGTASGSEIPIEERSPDEVLNFWGSPIARPHTLVRNPAFDVTPAHLVTAIITEVGICSAPDPMGISRLFSDSVSG